jgi:septum formation protein
MTTIVLASQSTSRRRLLESAGLSPKIIVSHVDEETDFFNSLSAADMVIALAITKAHTVREQIDFPAIIIGCDSTFEFDGQSLGKPGTPRLLPNVQNEFVGSQGYFIPDIASLIQSKILKFLIG